ncbi:MAG: VWA domain-containing protein [Acidiferrobacterales bacterium]
MSNVYLNRLFVIVLAAVVVAAGCSMRPSSDNPPTSINTPDSRARNAAKHEGAKLPQEKKASPANAERIATEVTAIPPVKGKTRDMRLSRLPASAGVVSSAEPHTLRMPSEPLDRETYAHFDDNPIKRVVEHPVSTFSIDVDTGAYANVRRLLRAGRLPVHDAVRVEELINYFSYNYPAPDDSKRPFSVSTVIAPAPWSTDRHLLHIGIKGYDITKEALPPANLVFLVDVSGSMRASNKLELLKTSLKLLARQLRQQDRIAIVVYAGASGVVLEPVPGNASGKIIAALDSLTAGGSTNGGAGIRLAYAMAEQTFVPNGINRVLLATDGDFNVGTVNFEALKNLIEEKRKTGISLTTLGFGTGNYNDHLMEQLADAGNGNYAYIDNLNEAQKVLVDELSSTMHTIAKDVKIQIEFNPNVVAEYRLIGYENRALKREDFDNDKVDAGEIGAGHTVTALYEVVLQGSTAVRLEPLRYSAEKPSGTAHAEELAFLRIRYKLPDSNKSTLMEWALKSRDVLADIAQSPDNFRFSAAVAAFAQILRGGKYTGEMSYDDVAALARNARGQDRFGYRGEFIQLVNLAQSLAGTSKQASR